MLDGVTYASRTRDTIPHTKSFQEVLHHIDSLDYPNMWKFMKLRQPSPSNKSKNSNEGETHDAQHEGGATVSPNTQFLAQGRRRAKVPWRWLTVASD